MGQAKVNHCVVEECRAKKVIKEQLLNALRWDLRYGLCTHSESLLVSVPQHRQLATAQTPVPFQPATRHLR